MRKHVFGSFQPGQLKPACSATEASMRFGILVTETISGYLGLSPDSVIRFGQISQIINHYLFCSPKYPKFKFLSSLQTPAICGVWREPAGWED